MSDSPIIVALDYADRDAARILVQKLSPSLCRLKVGKQMFTAFGPDWVKELVDKGFDVFLDLKFHDIPNTVAKACESACDLGVWMMNVHASGGSAMMKAARIALDQKGSNALLIAVTVLTSMQQEDLAEIGIDVTPEQMVRRLAGLANQAGCNGIVCSAQEAAGMKRIYGSDFCLVTPGIRLNDSKQDDQKRVVTPKQAIANGSDYLVIGRPITQSDSPNKTLESILQQI